jgi:NADH-quinone oxidoreductase subunit M
VILAAIYLLWMFQRVFLGPLENEENKRLRDVNRRELAVFIAFLIFIVWIGIYPTPYFNLMGDTVNSLVNSLGTTLAAVP